MAEQKPNRYQFFKGTSDAITRKTLLWRYMTFEKFCWLIETSKLYHARLDKFDDPFEGSVTEEYARQRALADHPAQNLANRYEPWIHMALTYRSYATCWHASDHESDAQWRLYGSGGAGIAVVTKMSRLEVCVDISPHRHAFLGQIEYVDFKTHDMRRPLGTRMRVGFTKRKSFEHEREVRGLIQAELPFSGPHLELTEDQLQLLKRTMPPGVNAPVNLVELLEAIVLSPLAPAHVEKLVRIVTARHSLEHLVKRSELEGTPIY